MIIGLTGSIASGKSTVSEMFKKKGFAVVDADAIAHSIVSPGSKVMLAIEEEFGESILNEDGSLHRENLGKRIFGNQEERQKLNTIMHPAIRQEMNRQKEQYLNDGAQTVIMDIPLLFESKLQSFVEKIVVVSVSPEIQKERLMKRNNLSEAEAEVRIQSQLPMKIKERGAHGVLHNDGDLTDLENKLTNLLAEWGIKP